MRKIPLKHGFMALVDDDDFELVDRFRWHLRPHEGGRRFYVSRHIYNAEGRNSTQSMHTLITGWLLVDHANGDGLDNRRANLRDATPAQNSANACRRKDNTSGFKGVSVMPSGFWQARIRMKSLGTFATREDAARAYDVAAIATWGEYAQLNFPEETVA